MNTSNLHSTLKRNSLILKNKNEYIMTAEYCWMTPKNNSSYYLRNSEIKNFKYKQYQPMKGIEIK